MKPVAEFLTPPGAGAVAVVRIRGVDAITNLPAGLIRRRSPNSLRTPHSALRTCQVVYADLLAGDGSTVDDVLVSRGPDGSIEFHCHGGAAVAEAVRAALESAGIAPVEPVGEPQTLTDEIALAVSLAPTWRCAELLLAQAETGLARVARTGSALESIVEFAVGRRLVEPPTVSIVGPVNVGKSTLANALFGRPHSIVSDRPGTTRDVLRAVAQVGAFAVELVDTAGIRATDDAVEREGVRRALDQARRADLRLVVFDRSLPRPNEPAGLERDPLRWDRHSCLSFHGDIGQSGMSVPPQVAGVNVSGTASTITVLNKSDLPAHPDWAGAGVAVSAAAGDGLDELRSRMLQLLGLSAHAPDTPIAFTARQQRLLDAARADPACAADRLRELLDGPAS